MYVSCTARHECICIYVHVHSCKILTKVWEIFSGSIYILQNLLARCLQETCKKVASLARFSQEKGHFPCKNLALASLLHESCTIFAILACKNCATFLQDLQNIFPWDLHIMITCILVENPISV